LNRVLRWLRGAFGIALTWGVAWSIAGVIVAFVLRSLRAAEGSNLPLLEANLAVAATVFSIIGFLNGLGFSIALAASERRRSFNELSPRRIALWGVLGGLSYPAFFALSNFVDGFRLPNDFLVAIPICAAFGALSAWSILSIARRAKDASHSQLGTGAAPDFGTPSRDREAARSPY
jgi:hypothetical protein